MIRRCDEKDFDTILDVINDSAQCYRGVIDPDCWNDPYMSADYLRHEIDNGVRFWSFERDEVIIGVMGVQDVMDVTLVRHVYVKSASRNSGAGSALLERIREMTDKPILMGAYKAAVWALDFYEKHGFKLIDGEEKNRLLKKYWSLPDTQIETSVVMAEEKWFLTDK